MSVLATIPPGVIDAHAHLVPRVLPRVATALSRPWVRCMDETRAQLVADERTVRDLDHRCWDVTARITTMDEESVAMQVVSPMPELLTPWLPARDTQDIARYVNEAIATLVSLRPDRFLGLGMVSLQDPDAASRQLEAIRDMGLSGVEVPADVAGTRLSDGVLRPFLAEIERQELTVFVHPLRPLDLGLAFPAADALVGYPMQTGRAVVDLASAQVLESLPRLKLLFAHGGGVAATLLKRCAHGWRVVPAVRAALPIDPLEVARCFYYDTLLYDAASIRFLADTFGTDRLLVGSDFPFALREAHPGHLLAAAGISEDARRLMQRETALRLFNSRGGLARPSPPSR